MQSHPIQRAALMPLQKLLKRPRETGIDMGQFAVTLCEGLCQMHSVCRPVAWWSNATMELGCLGSDPGTSSCATHSCTLHPDFSICKMGMVQNFLQGVTEHFRNEHTCSSRLPGTHEERSWLRVHWTLTITPEIRWKIQG